MRKIFTLLLFTFCCLQVLPQNPKTVKIQSGEYEREYMLYVPEKYNENNPSGLIVCLHGFNRTMDDFFNNYNIVALAEELNMIVLAPQALPEKDPVVIFTLQAIMASGINIPMGLDAVWGCGLQATADVRIFDSNLDVTLNKGVDDVTFIHQIISKTETDYNIIPENKFIFGTSMGGYMSYQYALYHGNDLSGLINVCGSMGTNIKNSDGAVKIPICDFQSVDDEVVPYYGSMNFAPMVDVTLCQNKEDVISFWVDKNGANTDPVIENINYYPSTTGHSVTKYTYLGDNKVIHYKMEGALHNHIFNKETDCMDYIEETAKFIMAHSKLSNSGNDVFTQPKQLIIYPNPVVGPLVKLNVEKGLAAIYTLTGQKVYSGAFESGTVNIGTLNSGIYIIRVTAGNETYQGKLIVR